MTRLSKSKIISGLQCPKRLYLEVKRPELMEVSEDTERIFAQGHAVGEVARDLEENGILIDTGSNLKHALKQTHELMQTGLTQPLFEATFSHDDILVKADILKPVRRQIDFIEIKSSTEVKDYHLNDCAIQTWVIEEAGQPLRSIQLGHIDNTFVYEREGEYDGLLAYEDITKPVRALTKQVPGWVIDLRAILAKSKEPDIAPGPQCNKPFACPFQDYCSPETTDYPVTSLPNVRGLAATLQDEGILDIRDIPAGRLSNATQERIRQVVKSGKPKLDPAAAKVLAKLPYPRYYLDFETIQFAVPRWLGTRPYEQLPFQWSCHIEQHDGTLDHKEFLDVTGQSPLRGFAESVIAVAGKMGPVLVYNATFESGVLRKLAERFTDLAPALNTVIARLVDLLPLTRANYYHPDMHGSWSLKAVLPTIAPDLDYSALPGAQHGGQAQDAYLACLNNPDDKEKHEIEQGLRAYCHLDTLAMVRLAAFLAGGTSR